MFMNLKRHAAGIAVGVATLAMTALPAVAAELTIGRGNEQSSIDPHFARTGNNQMTALHIFDRLVLTDENSNAVPGLAVSWRNIDPNTWEIKLREGVKFHNGNDFTAEDVLFSFERVPNVPNSPASFARYLTQIETIEATDSYTLRVTSNVANPLFVNELGLIYIVDKETVGDATTDDFNSGKVAVGTGPFRFVEWVPGDRMVLERYDDYWGGKAAFEKVTVKYISNSAARVAALLSGDVDLIDLVPPADLPRLRADANFRTHERATDRLVYLGLNQRDEVPLLTDLDGNPLPENPFKDRRVRQAVSKMIDRAALIDRILYGSGEPASQSVPSTMWGYNPDVTVDTVDVEGAKALLTEAGYPDGFGVTLHGSNDRFLLDGEVAQALGQMLARGGLKVNEVVTKPYSVYTKEAGRGEYAMFTFSFGNSTGESSRPLNSLYHTYDKDAGLGTLNRARYSNPEYDAIIKAALDIFDMTEREAAMKKAAAFQGEDMGLVPLYFQALAWASRADIAYTPRGDERTLAIHARPASN